MRYAKDHKEKTRQRLVETAARLIRRDGIAGTGVIGLAAELGLTQGALYKHFSTKDDIVEAAAIEATRQMHVKLGKVISDAREAGESTIDAIIAWYLDPEHRDLASEGCMVSALGGELARQTLAVREATLSSVNQVVELLAAEIPGGSSKRAMGLYALMVGTLQLARIAPRLEDRTTILAGGKTAAHAFVKGGL